MRGFLLRQYHKAVLRNEWNICSMLECVPGIRYLDLGCSDGEKTRTYAKYIGAGEVYGIDIDCRNTNTGVSAMMKDLNLPWHLGFRDGVDVVTANQVIEHLHNSDQFMESLYAVLKPGGYAVISTENLASWGNIAALLGGWQPFSLANFSQKHRVVGNPFTLHSNLSMEEGHSPRHCRVYTALGLRDYLEKSGFTVEGIKGASLFPAGWRHAHYITMKVRKNEED